MRTPKFTDLDRYQVPYKPSNKTDVAATFRRIRAEQAKNLAEQAVKVQTLKRATK